VDCGFKLPIRLNDSLKACKKYLNVVAHNDFSVCLFL
jgi:hypothetical protein